MATYQTIVVIGGAERGRFIEGTLAAITPKPGTMLELEAAGTYKLWTGGGTDGERDEVIVLRENEGLGKTVDDAYASGQHFYGYIPIAGDEVQVLFKNVSGTADDVAIADKLIIDSGTGKVIVTTGSPEMEPFKALEAITDPTADTLLLVRVTGQ